MPRCAKHGQKGFTIQEMLLVIVILVILLAVSVVGILTYMRQLRLAELDNSAREIFLAAQNRAVLLSGGQRLEGLVIHESGDNKIEHVNVIPDSAETTQITVYYIHSADPEIKELLPDGSIDPTLWEGDFWITYEPESGSVVDVFFSDEGELPVDGDFSAFYGTWRAADKSERMDSDPMIGYYGGESAQSGTTLSLRTPVIDIVNGDDLLVKVTYWVPRTLDLGAGNAVNLEVKLSYGRETLTLEQADAVPESSSDVTYLSYAYTWTLDSLTEDGKQFKDLFAAPGSEPPVYGGDFTVTAEVSYDGSLKVNGARKSATDNSLFATGSGGGTAYIACLRHLQNLDVDFSGVGGKTAAVQQSDIPKVEGYTFQPIENGALQSYDGGEFAVYGLHIAASGTEPAGLFGTFSGTGTQAKTLRGISLVNTVVSAGEGPAGALVGDGAYLTLDRCRVYWENQSEQATNLRGDLGDSDHGLYYQVTGTGLAGGLAGRLSNSDITGCSASTLVAGDTAGGLAGEAGGLTVTGSYAASYLAGDNTAGLVGNLAGSADFSKTYAVGFMDTDGTAAGLCLGTGTADVAQSYSAMLFTVKDGVTNYPLCQRGRYDGYTRFLSSERFNFVETEEAEGTDKTHEVSYADLTNPAQWDDLFGGAFAAKSAAQSHPYNLQTTLSLTTFLYPGLAELDHWGDWGAQFQNGSLVYYEQYDDGSYSFSKGDMADGKRVVLDGYAVAYKSTDSISVIGGVLTVTYQGKDGQVTKTYEYTENDSIYTVKGVADVTVGSSNYYLLPLPDEVVNTEYAAPDFYQKITIREEREGQEGTEKSYYYNPHFANAILPYEEKLDLGTLANRLQAVVRSPRHLYMLSKYETYYASMHQYLFLQELDLDYSGYTGYDLFADPGWSQAPIGVSGASPFRGSYYGDHHLITGVHTAVMDGSGSSYQYTGLFGYTTGVLEDVVYEMTQALAVTQSGSGSPTLYAGALAGYNGGSVTNCAAYAVQLRASGYAYSTIYLGGLVGRNQGVIRNSAVEGAAITANASMSHAYAGGFVGYNGAGGIIDQCYAVGKASASRARYGTVYACGFAGRSMGSLSRSYAAVSLAVEGEAVDFGFCPDASTDCVYLNDGNFTYRGEHYAAQYSDPAAEAVNWDRLTGADTAAALGMGDQVYAARGGDYPYPGAVTDAAGSYVHYGQWPDQMDLGPMGVYYWEKLTIDGTDSYHFSVLSLNNGQVERRSTLSTAHGDGGVVTEYGYGYFHQAGTDAPTLRSEGIGYGGSVSFTAQDSLENDAANSTLGTLMGGQYEFHSYNTWGTDEEKEGLFTVGSGQASGTQPPYGTWTLKQGGVTFSVRLNPFFADAMATESESLPGTEHNPYGVRSIDQLQFINWNYNAKSTVRRMDTGNMDKFPYLCYGKNWNWTLRPFYWEQTHDLEGKKGEKHTPIAGVYDATTENQGILFGWFGGTYDGNDYLIADVNIAPYSQSIDDATSCVGLFGAVYNGTLKNIVLYSTDGTATVTGSNCGQSRWYSIGALAGVAGSSTASAVVNCTVAGYTIKDTHQSTSQGGWGGTGLGGLIGVSDMSLVGCTAVANIVLDSVNNDHVRMGGLVGSCQGSISSCYAGGSITVEKDAVAKDMNDSSNPKGIYIGGIVGGIYMKPLRVGGNSSYTVGDTAVAAGGEPWLYNSLLNCYTYVELPAADSNQYIKGLYAVGGSGELTTNRWDGTWDHGETNYENNYYLESVVLTNNSKQAVLAKRNDLNQVIPLTYDQMADTDRGDGTDGLIDFLNNNGADFASVTTQTADGAPLSGRYSFGVDESLLGRDYPFPTILTQTSDVAAGNVASVHYGDWPLEGIRREKGALPVNLDLFADYRGGKAVRTEQLTLSGVEEGGDWKAESAHPEIADADIDGNGLLTVTAKQEGSTTVTVTYEVDGDKYSLTIDVNVTAELRVAAADSPMQILTNASVSTPLTLVDRDGEALPEDLAEKIDLSGFTVEYDAPYFTGAAVSQEGGLALAAQSGGTAGTTHMTVGYDFRYLDSDYHATSALTFQIMAAEITLEPLEFSFPAEAVNSEQTRNYDLSGFAVVVGEEEQTPADLTITAFEEVAAAFKDVIWVQWDKNQDGSDNVGVLSVTAYSQTLYPTPASVRVQFRFTYGGSVHTIWANLPVTVTQEAGAGEGEQP